MSADEVKAEFVLPPVALRRRVCAPVAALLAACSSTAGTAASSATSGSGSSPTIPASAFTDHTGLTPTSVTVRECSIRPVSFHPGASGGTDAYADDVNSTGGVNGRKIAVNASNDQFQGAPNRDQTQAAIDDDSALVGSFSLEDTFGATVLAAHPSVANVSVALSQQASGLPNTFIVNPVRFGRPLGGLDYFKQLYPGDIAHTGAILADEPSAQKTWTAEEQAMVSLGYKVIADPTYAITQTDFTPEVVAMKNDGVKILFMEQLPQNYAGAVVQALNEQNFHPVVVLGTAGYSEAFVPTSGECGSTRTASGSTRTRRSTSARMHPSFRRTRRSFTGSRSPAPASSRTSSRSMVGSPPSCSSRH